MFTTSLFKDEAQLQQRKRTSLMKQSYLTLKKNNKSEKRDKMNEEKIKRILIITLLCVM